jgi:hypothetical protein
MPAYDSDLFDPPAPLGRVNLRAIASDRTITNVPMLIDSGADLTLVSEAIIADLGVNPRSEDRVALEAFDGSVTQVMSVELELMFLGITFRGRFPVIDSAVGILGRNVLNRFAVMLDGPNLNWRELTGS